MMMMMMMIIIIITIIMMMMLIMMMTVQIEQVVSEVVSETTMMHFHMLEVQKYCFAIAACLFSIHIMDIFTTAAKQS